MSKVLTIRQKGDFKKSLTFFTHLRKWSVRSILEKYGALGVQRLADATPKATGKTAASWSYEIKMDKSGATLCWKKFQHCGRRTNCSDHPIRTRDAERGVCAGRGLHQPCHCPDL